MFDYLNMGLVVIESILLFLALLVLPGISVDMDKKVYTNIKFLIFVTLSIPTLDAYSAYLTANENITHFNKNKELRCTNASSYLVSKKDGWKFDKTYFIKDSLMIRADHCKIFKK